MSTHENYKLSCHSFRKHWKINKHIGKISLTYMFKQSNMKKVIYLWLLHKHTIKEIILPNFPVSFTYFLFCTIYKIQFPSSGKSRKKIRRCCWPRARIRLCRPKHIYPGKGTKLVVLLLTSIIISIQKDGKRWKGEIWTCYSAAATSHQ
jgi:hypothetical protein